MTINPVKSGAVAYQGSMPAATANKRPEKMASIEPVKVEVQIESPKKQVFSGEDIKDVPQVTKQETDAIKRIIDSMNTLTDSTAVFGYHEDTHRVMIKIVDKETNEVIKEFPPEKMLDMLAKTWELLGLMVDERR